MTTPTRLPSAAGPIGGADLLRSLDLLVDGPVLWGVTVPASSPGVFVIELPAPQALVSIDAAAVRGWLEHVPDLQVDGLRPSVAELQARLASFWLPGQAILYIGSSSKSVGARLAGMYRTPLGDRRPQPAGYWLKTLPDLRRARIWWAVTPDPELYEDAALDAFSTATGGALPFAVLATPSGRRKEHGLTQPLREVEDEANGPLRSPALARSRELESARASRRGVRRSALGGSEPDQEAARRAAAKAPPRTAPKGAPRTAGTRPRTTKAGSRIPAGPESAITGTAAPGTPVRRPSAAALAAAAVAAAAEPTYLSAAGLDALRIELEELTTHRRPEVISRIKAARELGDLSENADYEAARKEQSFLEGRIQQLEQLIKSAAIIDESQSGHVVVLGSTVVVDSVQHGEETFTIVGSIEADAAAGKISYTSPIGRALMGKRAGEKVRIQVPAGAMEYQVVEVR